MESEPKKRRRPWVIAAVVIGLGTAALATYIVTQSSRATPYRRMAVPLGEGPSKGPEDALVTIVEFSDFQ